MRKGGKQRVVEWAGPDAAAESAGRPRFRLADLSTALAGRWSLASGLARAGAAILIVSAVFVVVFRSVDGLDPAVENVKMPSIVKTTRSVVEPKPEPVRRASRSSAWWLRPVDIEQSFFDTDPGTPGELCRRLADLGYARARWAESKLFKNEWECSSDLEQEGETGQSFVVVRGGAKDDISRLMLKLTAPNADSRGALVRKAEETLRILSAATGLVLSAEALPLLTEWRVGATWTSQGTYRTVAEGGAETTRVLTMTMTPPLERPPGDDCRQTCRDWARSYGTEVAEARRVTAVPRPVR